MEHKYYLPQDDTGRVVWFENFYNKLLIYGATFGIDATALSNLQNDKLMFTTIVTFLQLVKDYLKALATFKVEISTGVSVATLNMPISPTITPPTAVAAGIFTRVADMVTLIKHNPNYTDTIGNDLGIIGTEINPDFATAKPVPQLSIRSSQVYIKWKKEHTDSVDIQADYDDGAGFKTIGRITGNHFVDPHLPAAGNTKIYRYKLRYVVANEEVGFWSDDEEITVTGI